MTKYTILMAYTTFLFFVMQIGSMAGATLIKNAPEPPTPPEAITDIFGFATFIVNNIVYFFTLMTVSSDYLIFGLVVLTPFVIFLIWIVLELIATAIP